jgi:single-stranded DNA-binding protein
MALSINRHEVYGNVGHMEMKEFGDGTPVLNLSIYETYRNGDPDATGDDRYLSQRFNVSFVGKAAELVEGLAEVGKPLFVSGRGVTKTYTDDDGNERMFYQIKGREFVAPFAGKTNAPEANSDEEFTRDDDLPF